MNETRLFNVDELETALIQKTMNEIYDALEERGYNPMNQLVGYLISGDPGYISSYKEARTKISKINRTKIIEVLVRNMVK